MSEPVPTETDQSDTDRDTGDEQETPVTIDAVNIERAPGFETSGFSIEDFSPGVNVVYGANAAGKTTLSEAIQCSLWPDEAPSSVSVRTDVTYDGDSRRIEVGTGVVEHIRDGASADPIPVPSLVGGRRYSLSLHDMLQEETDDGEFANVIQRESTGGFDIDAIRDEFDIPGTLSDPSAEVVLGKALTHLVTGDGTRAAALLAEEFETVCERSAPRLAETDAGHPAACHLHERADDEAPLRSPDADD